MRHSLIVILSLLSIQTYAQYYTSGSDPARLKWRQINTPTVKLVFEKNFEKEALRLAAYIDSIAPLVSTTLGNHKPGRINMLIHSQTAYSNGFVSWAPKRAELYSTPNQNINSVDWLDHLVTHEYRHVVQIDKLNKGFTRIASLLLGQQAPGAVSGMYLPMWFMEGDAVTTETSLSKSGRGRSFVFNQELKAQLVENGAYSYDKAYMGSYRNYVPDYYKMGYPLTAISRSQFGSEIWDKAIDKTGRSIWIPNPFRRSLKQQTGFSPPKLYYHIFKQLGDEWITETEQTKTTPYSSIVNYNSDYINFNNPVAINDSTLICELKGPGIRSQIAEINSKKGQVNTLIYTGIREEEPISANNDMIVWSEIKYHTRWENESFSIIKIYDRQTSKTNNITRKTRYFSPSIHPQKPLIAVVEATTDYHFYIVLIDAKNGQIIERIPSPENQYILTPSWNSNGSNLVTILQGEKGRAIYSLNTETGAWSLLKEYSFDETRHPFLDGDDLWYSAKGDVSEEIYHLNLHNHTTNRLTSSKYGASHPSVMPQSKKLVYSNYTDKGYRPVLYISNSSISDTANKQLSVIDKLAKKISSQEDTIIGNKTSSNLYSVKKYSKLNLIGLHSWAPVSPDFNDEAIHSGIGIMSQNLLGTTIITAGYNSDPAFSSEKYHINLSYRGLYPIFDLDFNFGDSKYEINGYYIGTDEIYRLNINENINHMYLKAGMRIPFNLSGGKYIRRLEPEIKFTYQQRTGFSYIKEFYSLQDDILVPTGEKETETYRSIDFKGMEYSLYFYNIQRNAERDVSYRMGQIVQLAYRNTPWGNYMAGSVFGVHTRLYLPGIGKHHAIAVDHDWQSFKDGDLSYTIDNYNQYYRCNKLFSYPRGYSNMYSDNLYIFRSTYMMPLWNPDIAITGLAYIKRLRLNIFHDAAIVNYNLTRADNGLKDAYSYTATSTGLELFADTHFLRFILPFSVGYRVGYRNTDNSTFHEAILTTSISGFLVNNR